MYFIEFGYKVLIHHFTTHFCNIFSCNILLIERLLLINIITKHFPPFYLYIFSNILCVMAFLGSSSLGASIRLPVVDYDEGANRQMELLILEGNVDNHFRLSVDDRGVRIVHRNFFITNKVLMYTHVQN